MKYLEIRSVVLETKTNEALVSPITIMDLVTWSKAETSLSKTRLNRHIGKIWMDSRKIIPGDIFLAIKSDRDDGHKYVTSALKAGALAAIVSRKYVGEYPPSVVKKLIIVSEPLKALQAMAAQYRKKLSIPFIAITGSNGKTTTRHFITSLLGAQFVVGTSESNWNNHLGVPLSILRLTNKENIAVLEFGANHQNEIAPLTQITKPDIGVITNIGYAHIGNFGSLATTTSTKYEITKGISKKNGLLLLNGDDHRLVKKNREESFPSVLFGTSQKCDFRAQNIEISKAGNPSFYIDKRKYMLSIPGRHFIYCALPAVFIARKYGVPENLITEVIYQIKPDSMRGKIVEKAGVTFIVDCYNANPTSMNAALSLLSDLTCRKRKCVIVGDMRELGRYAKRMHLQLGKQIAESKAAILIAVGEYAQGIAQGALKNGMSSKNISTAVDSEEAAKYAQTIMREGDMILLKGSRAIELEKVFEQFH